MIKVTGVAEVKKNMQVVENKLDDQIKKSLLKAGSFLLGECIPVTPKDTGELRKSGKTYLSKKNKEYTEKVVFGNAKAHYALKVHEMPAETTNWSEPGTSSKYLERPFRENKDKIISIIKEGIKI